MRHRLRLWIPDQARYDESIVAMTQIRFVSLAETGSTNDEVMARARQGEEEGLWLRADRQIGGRGRQGRSWRSPPGNLYASTLVRLRPDDPPPASLALVAALALHDAVDATLPPGAPRPTLKWPNDLLIEGAKLSGILLERDGDAVVVGTGVNLAHHPSDIDRPATSFAAFGPPPTPDDFLQLLAQCFSNRLALWRDEGLPAIRAAWLERAYPEGTPIAVHDADGEPLKGQFAGLDDNGSLLLRLADGSVRAMHAGDVFLI